MNPSQRIDEALFEAALSIGDVTARQAFLEKACGGDAEQRARIEDWLAAQTAAEDFFGGATEGRMDLLTEAGDGKSAVTASDQEGSLSTKSISDGKLKAGPGTPSINDSDTATEIPHPRPAPWAAEEIAELIRLLVKRDSSQKYKLQDELGRGGMGMVLDSRDMNLHRSVAMKVILNPSQASRQRVLQFIEEAQITAQLQHPGIMPIYELGVDETGNVFYTMKRVSGQTLKEILQGIQDGRKDVIAQYPLPQLLNLLLRVADAVAYAHSKGVVHRDIKPDNIMVGSYGEVLVLDWGMAKILKPKGHVPDSQWITLSGDSTAGAKNSSATIQSIRSDNVLAGSALTTQAGNVMGTPSYMSPEQARGEPGKIDERSDIYALGAILYQFLTGQTPIQWGEANSKHDVMAILERVRKGDIQRPTASAQAPESLIAVAMKALATDPQQRYQSVKEFQRDIEAYLNGFATSAENSNLWKSIRLFVRRHRAASLTATAVSALLLGLITTGYLLNRQERQKAETALANYQTEQTHRQADRKQSAPAFVDAGRLFIEAGNSTRALAMLATAIDYDSELAEAHLLRALLLIQAADYRQALTEAQRYQQLAPAEESGPLLRQVCETGLAQPSERPYSADLANICINRGVSTLASAFLKSSKELLALYQTKLNAAWPGSGKQLTVTKDALFKLDLSTCKDLLDLSPLKGMPLTELSLSDTPVSDLSPLKGMQLTTLNCWGTSRLRDISPLADMPLKSVNIGLTQVTNLAPLKGAPLTELNLEGCKVTDLGPIAGLPLTRLTLHNTRVSNLAPLKGMPLQQLNLYQTFVNDLSPLKNMPLTALDLRYTNVRDLTSIKSAPLITLELDPSMISEVLHEIKTLQKINGLPVAEFWKQAKRP